MTLAILRAPAPARAVSVRREHVEVPSVEDVRIVDAAAGIGSVQLTSFQKTTAADLEVALRRLDAQGMRSLVIDLRGNPGGLLSAAVDVADLFLERGLDMVARNPREHLGIEPAGVGLRELGDLLAEGLLAVAAADVAVDLRQVVTLLQVQAVARPADGAFVAQATDPFIDAAVEAARRHAVPRPSPKPAANAAANAGSKATGRVTAAR